MFRVTRSRLGRPDAGPPDAGRVRTAGRRHHPALAVLALATMLAVPTGAGAMVNPQLGGTLPNFDTRGGKSASSGARAARADLERSLGPQGIVAADAKSAGVRRVARTDGFLTAASSRDAATIALDYVRSHRGAFGLGEDDLAALTVTSRYVSPDGVTHVAYVQTDRGIRAYDNVLYANVTESGRLVNIGGAAVEGLGVVIRERLDRRPPGAAGGARRGGRDDRGPQCQGGWRPGAADDVLQRRHGAADALRRRGPRPAWRGS